MSDFFKFDKISRLGTQETRGILEGTVWIAPKLDGTNGSLWNRDGLLQAGSRNRLLSPLGADNAGFRAAMTDDWNIIKFFLSHPHLRLFGEWLVPHTIKGYQEDAWRKFYVYDVWDSVNEQWLLPDIWGPMVAAYSLDFIPHHRFENPTMVEIEKILTEYTGWLMKPGEVGEGIVLKNFSFINRYGNCRYAKYIRENFQSRPKKVVTDNQVESDIASVCVIEGLVKKTAYKILNQGERIPTGDGFDILWDRKTMIPRLMETVYHDVITEKLWDCLKSMKQPTVNFKILRAEVCRTVKLVGKEYF